MISHPGFRPDFVLQILLLAITSAIAMPLAVDAQVTEKLLPGTIQVEVTNPIDRERSNVFVRIPPDDLSKAARDFNKNAFAVFIGDEEIPSQYNEPPIASDGIVLVLDRMKGKETVTLTIRYSTTGGYKGKYRKRTQAELSRKTGGEFVNREYVGGKFENVNYLRVPKEHKDHSWFIRYEGPGWESDKVAYRFYLDQRNATDAFGKRTKDMVLQNVGQDGFDSYHEMQPWGMDIMKVGKSLGVGSIGYNHNGNVTRVEKTDSVTCEITKDGEIYSEIETTYYGWALGPEKVNLVSTISIHAGARQTFQQIRIQGALDRISTGIVKDAKAELKVVDGDQTKFGYLATYGRQSLNEDDLGLAVLFSTSAIIGFTEDKESHVVDLRVDGGRAEYYFLAAWSGEPDGINSKEAFERYVETLAQELANPVTVQVRR